MKTSLKKMMKNRYWNSVLYLKTKLHYARSWNCSLAGIEYRLFTL